jgi:TP901 family phage tail tape measure protein
MADAEANISINVDASRAIGTLKALQAQLSGMYSAMSKGGAQAQAQVGQLSQNLVNSINNTGRFAASFTNLSSTTDSFTNALEKNKLSMGQYFSFAGASTKSFGKLFSSEFATIDKVARERVKTLQTQYIKLGRDANGAMRGIAVRPLALDMNNLGTQVMMTAQKQQIFNKLIQQGSTNLLNFGKNTQWAGRQLMVGFTIPLTILGGIAIKEFQKIEEQAVKFKRVYGDMFNTNAETEKALENVRKLADEFTKYGIAVEKTIELAAKVAQMGNVGAALEAQVTQATRLSVLGGMEQMEALDTTISLTNAFGVAVEDLESKINFLNAAENQTILAIEDFNTAIPLAGSVVQQLGGDVEDLAFFLTAMREGGINASQAGNALKSSLGRLIAPSRNAKETLAGFGIDVMGIVEKNAGDLKGTIMVLGRELDKLDPLNRARSIEALFGKFQFARMSTLFQNISRDGSQANKILELTQANTEELGILAARELKRVEESPMFKLQKQIEQLQAALAPLGQEFVKLVTPIVEMATNVLKWFNSLGDGWKSFITNFVALTGVIAPVFLMAFGLIANGFANFIKGIQKVSQFLGLLSGSSKMVGTGMEYQSQQMLESGAIAASLSQDHQRLAQVLTSEAAALNLLSGSYNQAAIAARGFAAVNIRPDIVVTPGATPSPSRYNPFMPPKKYADGVVSVPGPKGAGDIIPAMLSPGEAVIPAKMAQRYAPFIKAMIAGNIPGYENGNLDELDIVRQQIGGVASRVATTELSAPKIAEKLFEETQKRARDFGITLSDAANQVESAFANVSDGAIKNATALENESAEFRAIKRERVDAQGDVFAHIGGPGSMTAKQAASYIPEEDTSAAARDIRDISAVLPEKKLNFTSRYGMQTSRSLNLDLANQGAKKDDLVSDMQSRGSAKWEEAYTAGGIDVSSEDAKAFIEEQDRRLIQKISDSRAKLVVDTTEQLEQIAESERGNYVALDQLESEVFEEMQADMSIPESQRRMQAEGRQKALSRRKQVRTSKFTNAEAEAIFDIAQDTSDPSRQAAAQRLQKTLKIKEGPEGRGVYTGTKRNIEQGLRGGAETALLEAGQAGGKNISQGTDLSDSNFDNVAEEIKSKMVELGKAAGDGVAQGTENSLQIASPSKRMFDLGKNAGDSLADGFDASRAGANGSELPPRPPSRPGSNLEPPLPPGMPPPPQVEQPGASGRFSRIGGAVARTAKKAGERVLTKVVTPLARAQGNRLVDSEGNVVYDPDTDPQFLAEEEARRQARVAPPGVVAARVAESEIAQRRNQYIFDQNLATYDDASGMFTATPAGKREGLKNEFSVLSNDIFESAEAAKRASKELRELSGAADEAARSVDQVEKEMGTGGRDGGGIPGGTASEEYDGEPMRMLPNGEMVTEKQYNKIVKKTDRQQKRQRRAGVAMRALGTATMVAGVATQAPKDMEILGLNVAETAQKFLPLIGGLTAILPVLLALPLPIAALVAVVGGAVALYFMYQKRLKEVTSAARELAEGLGAGSKAMNVFAEFAGKATATEIMTTKRQLGSIDVVLGKSEFAENFFGSDQGKAYVDRVQQGFDELGRSETIKKLGAQLSTAVISGALSYDEASGIAAEIGRAMSDTSISLAVLGSLAELIGPNGEDLLTNPLEVKIKILEQSAEDIFGETGTFEKLKSSITDPLREKGLSGFLDSLFTTPELGAQLAGEIVAFAEQRQQIYDADEVALNNRIDGLKEEETALRKQGKVLEANQKLAEIEDVTNKFWVERKRLLEDESSSLSMLVNQYKGMIDFDRQWQDQRRATIAQDIDAADKSRNLLKQYEALTGVRFDFNIDDLSDTEAMSEAYNLNTKTLNDLRKAYGDVFSQIGESIKSNFSESSEDVQKKVGTLVDEINNEARNLDTDLRFELLIGLKIGTIDFRQAENFLDKYAKDVEKITQDEIDAYRTERIRPGSLGEASDDEIRQRIADEGREVQENVGNVISKMGPGAGQQLFNIFEKVNDESEKLLSKNLSDAVNIGTPEALQGAQTMLDTVSSIAAYGENTIDVDAAIQFFVKNPEALENFTKKMADLDVLLSEYGDDLSAEVAFSTIFTTDSVGFNALMAQSEYFNSLPSSQKKLFVSTFLTQFITSFSTLGTAEGDATVSTWKAGPEGRTELGLSPIEISKMSDTEVFAAIATIAAQKVTEALRAAGYDVGDPEDVPTPTGGGGGPSGSILDPIVKDIRDYLDLQQEATTGWEASLDAIIKFGSSGAKSINSLSNQLRRANVSEPLIEKFLGMDPEEWDKRKNELFNFDIAGNITGMTDAGKAVQEAFNETTIAKATDKQRSLANSTRDQIVAIGKLRDAGADFKTAYQMVQDTALATAIATGKNTTAIKELVKEAKEAAALKEELEEMNEEEERRERLKKSLEDLNKKFQQRVDALKKIQSQAGKFSDAQIDLIFSNQDLMEVFLEPNIAPKALEQALKDAERKADLELQIKKMTLTGRESIVSEAFGKAMDAFSAEEKMIEIQFGAQAKEQDKIIDMAQREIASLQFIMEDYEAGLTEISNQEELINEAYEKRFEALDRISDINEKIASQQERQLDLAEALSSGDIAAAARAAQQMRSEAQKDSIDDQRKIMEQRQKIEIENLRSMSGMTRKELEDQIKDLENQIFRIEQERLRPAEEYSRLADLRMRDEIENLRILGKTKKEWESLQNEIDVARTRNWKFMEELADFANMIPQLLGEYRKPKPLPPPPPLPVPPAPAPRVRKRLNTQQKRAAGWTDGKGGIWQPPPRKYSSGGRVYRPMGGLIPYKMSGGSILDGIFPSLGSDTIPAMLTPGEFVIRRPAVTSFGLNNLEQINRGTYSGNSMYNYNLQVNVKSDANPEQIANTVMREIKRVDSKRIRDNRL